MRLRASALVVACMGTAALIAAPAASAKGDVKATLITQVPLDAPAGTELEVAWRLFSVDENGKRQPFGASGVYVRLLSASGAASEEGVAPARSYKTGEYAATVVVPEGGIRDIELGLMAWVSDAKGTRRGDMIFPITNDPVAGLAPIASPSPERSASSSSGTSPPWILVLVSTLFSAFALITVLLVRRSRGRKAAGAGRPGDRRSTQPVGTSYRQSLLGERPLLRRSARREPSPHPHARG